MERVRDLAVVTFEEFIKIGEGNIALPADAKSEDICSIMYTSGTSGVPKVF